MSMLLRGDGVSFGAQNRVVSSTTIDIIDDEGFIIGFITDMTERWNRPVQRIRHLSAMDAGRVIEIAPQVETIGLDVNGYSLYDKSQTDRRSLIHRMGSGLKAMKSLVSQSQSFNIIKRETHPSTGETVEDIYFMCWFESFTRTRAIGSITNVDRAAIACGQKE